MSSMGRLAAARAQRDMEMTALGSQNPSTGLTAPANASTPVIPFLSEVASIEDQIKEFNANVAQIAETRAHYLTSVDGNVDLDKAKLEELTEETRTLSQAIKKRIQDLAQYPQQGSTQIRANQIGLLRKRFLEAVQNYQKVERDGDFKSRQQISKQLHLVKPDATPEEVAAFIDRGDQQVFAQALTTSTRYGESRLAYQEVQDRQTDLQRIERSLHELSQLIKDMAIMVEQQDDAIDAVQDGAIDVERNTKAALDQTTIAVKHARSYRKGRWICFGIFVLVCCILAIVLGIVFGTRK